MNKIDKILNKIPEPSEANPEVPEHTKKDNAELTFSSESKEINYTEKQNEEITFVDKNKNVPEFSNEGKKIPPTYNENNTIFVNDNYIEIKPTKLKYFRNGQAAVYDLIKAIPIGEFLGIKKGQFDKERDGDQMLFDFLVAATNDPDFVHDNYDDFDAETINKITEIFGRLNHIEEKKEAARKNLQTQGTA